MLNYLLWLFCLMVRTKNCYVFYKGKIKPGLFSNICDPLINCKVLGHGEYILLRDILLYTVKDLAGALVFLELGWLSLYSFGYVKNLKPFLEDLYYIRIIYHRN